MSPFPPINQKFFDELTSRPFKFSHEFIKYIASIDITNWDHLTTHAQTLDDAHQFASMYQYDWSDPPMDSPLLEDLFILFTYSQYITAYPLNNVSTITLEMVNPRRFDTFRDAHTHTFYNDLQDALATVTVTPLGRTPTPLTASWNGPPGTPQPIGPPTIPPLSLIHI